MSISLCVGMSEATEALIDLMSTLLFGMPRLVPAVRRRLSNSVLHRVLPGHFCPFASTPRYF